jgi:hypothetical protein
VPLCALPFLLGNGWVKTLPRQRIHKKQQIFFLLCFFVCCRSRIRGKQGTCSSRITFQYFRLNENVYSLGNPVSTKRCSAGLAMRTGGGGGGGEVAVKLQTCCKLEHRRPHPGRFMQAALISLYSNRCSLTEQTIERTQSLIPKIVDRRFVRFYNLQSYPHNRPPWRPIRL